MFRATSLNSVWPAGVPFKVRSVLNRARCPILTVAMMLLAVTTRTPAEEARILASPWSAHQLTGHVEEREITPKRSRHGIKKAKRDYRPQWGYVPGRPVVVPAPLSTPYNSYPSSRGHRSRPIVSPLPMLNVVRNPQLTPYQAGGRPFADPMPSMSLLTPHYVIKVPPTYRWLGSGWQRTASATNHVTENR